MPQDSPLLECRCPAKINLTLAVTGRRKDGYHQLHSIVAQTEFGDELALRWDPGGQPDQDRAEVRGMDLPLAESSVNVALRRFREAVGLKHGAFSLALGKLIPAGAGLGGGSSDATAVLRAACSLLREQCQGLDLAAVAARVGSDCPLFLHDQPVLMEGRGETISLLPEGLAGRIRHRPVVLFKPAFSINTCEAYRRLAAGGYYSGAGKGASLLEAWADSDSVLPPRWNDFERLAEDWMPSLAVVLERLRRKLGLEARLSGSGSACFAFHDGDSSVIQCLRQELQSAWGEHYWMVETRMK